MKYNLRILMCMALGFSSYNAATAGPRILPPIIALTGAVPMAISTLEAPLQDKARIFLSSLTAQWADSLALLVLALPPEKASLFFQDLLVLSGKATSYESVLWAFRFLSPREMRLMVDMLSAMNNAQKKLFLDFLISLGPDFETLHAVFDLFPTMTPQAVEVFSQRWGSSAPSQKITILQELKGRDQVDQAESIF